MITGDLGAGLTPTIDTNVLLLQYSVEFIERLQEISHTCKAIFGALRQTLEDDRVDRVGNVLGNARQASHWQRVEADVLRQKADRGARITSLIRLCV